MTVGGKENLKSGGGQVQLSDGGRDETGFEEHAESPVLEVMVATSCMGWRSSNGMGPGVAERLIALSRGRSGTASAGVGSGTTIAAEEADGSGKGKGGLKRADASEVCASLAHAMAVGGFVKYDGINGMHASAADAAKIRKLIVAGGKGALRLLKLLNAISAAANYVRTGAQHQSVRFTKPMAPEILGAPLSTEAAAEIVVRLVVGQRYSSEDVRKWADEVTDWHSVARKLLMSYDGGGPGTRCSAVTSEPGLNRKRQIHTSKSRGG